MFNFNQITLKKPLLLTAVAVLFSFFSCTADESEAAQSNKKIEKTVNASASEPDGPGDGQTPPPPPAASATVNDGPGDGVPPPPPPPAKS